MIGAFTIQANAQTMATKWERTSRTGAAEAKPAWMTSAYTRGMAYHDGLVYFIRGSSKVISVVNAITGDDVTPSTAFDASAVTGSWPHVWDIEASTDGKVFSVNYTSGGSIAAIKLYMGDVSGGALTEVATLTPGSALKVGNKFTVVGSVADNTAEVWVPAADSRTVFVFTTADQGANWSSSEITLSGGNAMATSPVAVPLAPGGSSDFYVTGHGSKIQRFTSAGVYVTGSEITQTATTSRGGLKAFQLDGEDYIAVYTTRISNSTTDDNGRVQVFNVDNATSPVLEYTSQVLGDTDGAASYLGDVAVRVNSDDSYDVFAVDPDHGIAGFSSSEYLTITGTEGWRMLSSPTSDNSYDDLLGDLWTQGIGAGADVTTGTASVQLYNTGTDNFAAATDLTANMTAGAGFITYVYSDDDYTTSEADAGFPKTLSVAGTENTAPVVTTLNTEASAFTLVGNPFASTIDWDLLSPTDLTGAVYVYDNASSGYKTWNGTDGSLTDGLIMPFQGFWVQNSASITDPALSFTDAAKTTGGTFYKENINTASFKLLAEMDGFSNEAYLSFTEKGSIAKDNFDALELSPIDHADYLSLSTLIGDELIDINNLPFSLREEVEIPLQISSFQKEKEGYSLKSGEVTISWSQLSNINEDWTITLNDYDTGTIVNLREENSYSFVVSGNDDLVKSKTSFTILSPVSVTHEKRTDKTRLSITISPSSAVSNELDSKPTEFELDQNYPNPFNPSTNIKYTLNTTGNVSLTVYNLMGQKVATLVNGTKTQGTHQVTWDAGNMASGVYVYRLNVAGNVITKRMTLIK
jgi:hypothetical protein